MSKDRRALAIPSQTHDLVEIHSSISQTFDARPEPLYAALGSSFGADGAMENHLSLREAFPNITEMDYDEIDSPWYADDFSVQEITSGFFVIWLLMPLLEDKKPRQLCRPDTQSLTITSTPASSAKLQVKRDPWNSKSTCISTM
jgi:hypothetical protein